MHSRYIYAEYGLPNEHVARIYNEFMLNTRINISAVILFVDITFELL